MNNEMVRTTSEAPAPVPIGTGNRVMACAMVAVASFAMASCIWHVAVCVLAGRWSDAEGSLALLGIMAMGCSVFGRTLLRAAVTGLDPDSVDRAKADAEHRAMLAALRAAGEEHPEPGLGSKDG
jgi:hypothetical protein